MKIAVMGVHYGHIGGMFRSAVKAPNAELVGIVEPDDALYEQYTRDIDITRFPSLQEMLDATRADVVMEGVGHHEKVDMIETCAAAGAHVFLDKPLCRSLDDWNRIQTAVQNHNIRLTMFYTSRSHPPFIALRDAILAGELGEIVSLISTHPHKLGDWAPGWYFDPRIYTGTFSDVACHGVDQVRWLTGGECVGVHAIGACKKHTDGPPKAGNGPHSGVVSDEHGSMRDTHGGLADSRRLSLFRRHPLHHHGHKGVRPSAGVRGRQPAHRHRRQRGLRTRIPAGTQQQFRGEHGRRILRR